METVKNKFWPHRDLLHQEDSDLERLHDSCLVHHPPQSRGGGRGPGLQLVIQLSAGLLVFFVVLVCVLALTFQTPRGPRDRQMLHKPVHTDPNFSALYHQMLEAPGPGLPSPHSSLEDIFIAVKTSEKFHQTRLAPLLATWVKQARDSTFFFTDRVEGDMVRHRVEEQTMGLAEGHLLNTACPPDHSRQALCCKMQAELETFLQSSKSWFCHFDDDQYVNVAALEKKLRQFSSSEDWYLGKPSIERPLEILDRTHKEMEARVSFWFATGGAGFCLSKSLTARLKTLLEGEEDFSSLGEKMRLPDDVTMGYLVEQMAGVPLTKVEEFHSHLEPLRLVTDLEEQISFSYSSYSTETNVVEVPSPSFLESEDPTRFLSIHCFLQPSTPWCRTK